MASPPPSTGSKRQKYGKALRRIQNAILPSSRSSSQNSVSGAVLATGPSSVSHAPPAGSGGTPPAQTIVHQGTCAGPVPTVVYTGPAANPRPTTANNLRSVASSGLRTALQALEQSAHVFPPLQAAIGGLLACFDTIQESIENADDYANLTSELTTMANTLNQNLEELQSGDASGSATRIAQTIEVEVAHIHAHISQQQGHSTGRRIVDSIRNKEDVIKRYQRIEGLFRQLQLDIGLKILKNTNMQRVRTILRDLCPVDDARYNSSYSTTIKRHGCTTATRMEVQADLRHWVQDPTGAKVYWMNGMAGTGKTTIAYSLCEWLEENQQLGASFFYSRVSSSCRNVNQIVPTLAYQLARYSPVFQSALCEALKQDPDAGKLNAACQFKSLMKEPMQMMKDMIPEGVIVVIDALDECEDDQGMRLFLEILLKLAADLPLKFFVTSRPEPQICDRMELQGGYSPFILRLHDIEQSIVEEDIKKFLSEALSSLEPPPSDAQIGQLAKRAGKLFIYAATVVRYILPGRGPASSITRLNSMLAMDSSSAGSAPSNKRYKELDDLYTTILVAAFDDTDQEQEEIEAMRLVLWTAACAKEPMTALALSLFLDLTEEQVLSALQPLRSVLHVSEPDGLISTLHASFPDYIFDRLRSRHFYCDQTRHNELLARCCFDVMKEQLRFNICNLESSLVFDEDVSDLEQRSKALISLPLSYSCRYWGEHLQ